QPESNLDFRSPEPTEITPFLGNFPDPTGTSPRRIGNALILGLERRKMDRPQFEVADVFRCYGADYRLQNGASMSNAQHRVMTAIEVCRTAVLGGHLEQCDQCGHQRNAFNSCANRHDPKCQSLARAQWLQDRQAELLNTQYFHVVFTAPEQIATISYQ